MNQYVKYGDIFSHHEACPDCRKKGNDKRGNNLGVWKDGHKYCFSCQYWEDPGGSGVFKRRLNSEIEADDDKPLKSIPLDCSAYIPEKGMKWLKEYHLTDAQISRHAIKWSENKQQVVFPYYGEGGSIIAWQGRNFADWNKSKWYSQGDIHDFIHILNPKGLTIDDKCGIVLVEDIISAIRVSEFRPAMPLFGSECNTRQFARLKRFTDQVTLWLDYDKRGHAVKLAVRSGVLGLGAGIIITEKDPKAYPNDELKEYLLE